ncbi:MAG: TIGR02996 domain-containing protein [Gemmataceae bacterium]|nr:TIGR02996 domain-containing protein [Gemmataceae bacterium]
MMKQEEALLRAVLEDPDDEGVRLVYADWLEEHGEQARAEFIRVQVELAQLPPYDPPRFDLERRARQLLAGHEAEWAGALASMVMRWEFRRGLVEKVHLEADRFLASSDTLFRLAPVRHVQFEGQPDWRPEWFRCPALARLTGLDLTLVGLYEAGARALAASEYLVNLQTLGLGGTNITWSGGELEAQTWDGLDALAGSPYLMSLTALDLAGNTLSEFSPAGIRLLIDSPRRARLTSLSLEGTFVDIQALTRCPGLARLTSLNLSENDLQFEDEDAEALAACSHLANLASLNLGHCNLGVAAAQALASSPSLGKLLDLNLRHNYIEPGGVEALLTSPSLAALKALNLAVNWIGDTGAEVIASLPRLRGLVRLDLSHNKITDAGARALLESPHTGWLFELDLSGNDLSAGVSRALRERFGERVRVGP